MSGEDRPAERIGIALWMSEPAVAAVLAALARDGGAARFVGGCVRDTLLGRPIGDIDVATPLPPDEVMRRLDAAGIKGVPTGLAHGTVTAVAPLRHIEITTLRRDVETDGRHARVAFTDDWRADAARRDFTMNALFLDAGGQVFDPMGGLGDLKAGRVRFVGDPGTRIREDVLRLLRFYRFHAHYGRTEPDEAARAACRALVYLLPTLSGERVAAELLKLLAAADPAPTLELMRADGVLAVLLPEAQRLDLLRALVPLEETADPLRRLAALLVPDQAQVAAVAERLRLSNAQRERLLALAEPPWPFALRANQRDQHRALHHLGVGLFRDLVLLAMAETGEAERGRRLLRLAEGWRPREFPLKGRDVAALGVPPGPRMGELLAEVEEWWELGDFRADYLACRAELRKRAGWR